MNRLMSPSPLVACCEKLLLVYLALLPVMEPLSVQFLGFPFIVADAVFLLLAGCFLARAMIHRDAFAGCTKVCAFVALYVLALAVAAVTSSDPAASWRKLVVEIYLAGMAMIAFATIRSEEHLRRCIACWLLGTSFVVVASLVGVVMFYLGFRDPHANLLLSSFGSLPPGNYPRLNSLFFNANMYCHYLLVSLCLALVWAQRWGVPRRLTIGLIAAILVGALLSLSPCIGALFGFLGICIWKTTGRSQRPSVARTCGLAGLSVSLLFIVLMLLPPSHLSYLLGRPPDPNRETPPAPSSTVRSRKSSTVMVDSGAVCTG